MRSGSREGEWGKEGDRKSFVLFTEELSIGLCNLIKQMSYEIPNRFNWEERKQ